MLTNDIGNFFGSMTTIYGHLWSHGADEMETWRKAMIHNKVTPKDLQVAANRCLKEYPGHPPTMGQVIGLVKLEKPRNQRLITGKPFSLCMAQGNRILYSKILLTGGIKKETLKLCIEAKNALVFEAEQTDQDEVEFAAALDTQLRGIITGHEERRT